MKTHKRKALCKAVLAALTAMGTIGTMGAASAVNINPNGLGQVLIYPYYTTRTSSTAVATGAQNTYVSVTNSTSQAKAVKVRIMEGKNAREALDFNLFLSAGDVWTAAIVPTTATDAGGVGNAKIITSDKSCTYGVLTASPGIPFTNVAYVGDLGGDSMDRTNEGYIEMLEMGVITHAGLLTAINHVAGVAPCTAATLLTADSAGLVGYLSTATGGLFGGASLINPATGVDYSYDAVALEGWDATVGGQPSSATSLTPNIATGSSTTSIVLFNGAIKTATWSGSTTTWSGLNASRDAVSAAMMRNNVMNEFVLDTTTQSGTDWVVTFPTKRFYITGATALARQPFSNSFQGSSFGPAGSCDMVGWAGIGINHGLFVFDREEQIRTFVGGYSAGSYVTYNLCWTANVVMFNNATGSSTIFGSKNVLNMSTSYQNGWMKLGFLEPTMYLTPSTSSTNGVPDATPQSYYGLPVVGFMAQSFVNSLISSFGGTFEHKYSLDIR